MAKRIVKDVAYELIPFCKKLQCIGHVYDKKAKPTIEFARQMMSTKLKKKNPAFEVDMFFVDEGVKPYVLGEFTDGDIWTLETHEMSLGEIRSHFYARAEQAEEAAEALEIDPNLEEAPLSKTSAKGGAATKSGKK